MGWIGLFILGICLTSSYCHHEEGHESQDEQEDGGRSQTPVGESKRARYDGSQGGNWLEPLDIHKVYDACKNGVCLAEPAGCIAKKECHYMAAVQKDKVSNYYNFTVARLANTNDIYVGVGLSKSGVKMANTSIVACFQNSGTRDQMAVYWSANKNSITELFDQQGDYIFNRNVLYQDGKLMCAFQRKPSSTVKNHLFDLDRKNEYKLLIASGKSKYENGDLKMDYHGDHRRLSDTKYDFSQKSFSVRATESRFLLAVTATFTFFKLHMQ